MIFKEKIKSCKIWKELCAFARHNHRKRKVGKADLCGWVHRSQTLRDVGLTDRAIRILMSASQSPEF